MLHVLTWMCWFGGTCLPDAGLYDSLGHLLDLTAEPSIPSWLATALLAGVALASAGAATLSRDDRGGWWGLAGLFARLSPDGATNLHGYWIRFLGDNTVPGIAHGFN